VHVLVTINTDRINAWFNYETKFFVPQLYIQVQSKYFSYTIAEEPFENNP